MSLPPQSLDPLLVSLADSLRPRAHRSALALAPEWAHLTHRRRPHATRPHGRAPRLNGQSNEAVGATTDAIIASSDSMEIASHAGVAARCDSLTPACEFTTQKAFPPP